MSKDWGGGGLALNLRHIDTLIIAGPPTPHRRNTQVAGTSEQVVLITQPTSKETEREGEIKWARKNDSVFK